MSSNFWDFYHRGHHFRDEISIVYMEMQRLLRQAYGDDFTELFTWDHSGSNVGYISNMLVVYVWTIFEELMRSAFVTVYGDPALKEKYIRDNNFSWGEIREWLIDEGIFTANLKGFEPLIGELNARRNCLVHNRGIVDSQYINQVVKYGGVSAFTLGKHIWTSWDYHQQLENQLIFFQMHLSSTVETCLRNSISQEDNFFGEQPRA